MCTVKRFVQEESADKCPVIIIIKDPTGIALDIIYFIMVTTEMGRKAIGFGAVYAVKKLREWRFLLKSASEAASQTKHGRVPNGNASRKREKRKLEAESRLGFLHSIQRYIHSSRE